MMKQQRRFKDINIDGMTARWYDKNTKKNRLAEMKSYANEAAKYLQDECNVLELAPGPGYLAIEIAKLGICNKIVGLDISKDFVQIAQRNAKEADVLQNVEFKRGNAVDMPFPDNVFDFIICTAAFKNFKEPLKVLNQVHRVLKSGCTALIVDMNRNVSSQQIRYYTENLEASGIDKLFMKLMFRYFLRSGAYTRAEFTSMISKTAFKQFGIKEEGIGFYIYLTK